MAWLSGWDKRIKITVDESVLTDANDLTQFPLTLICKAGLSGIGTVDVSAIFDEVTTNGLKIAVTKADGETELYVEQELWDNGTESFVLHVSAPGWVIDSETDTDLYIYYDNDHADNTTYVKAVGEHGTNVWDANYMMVHHMHGAAYGTCIDATSNNNDMVGQASVPSYAQAGRLGNGVSYATDDNNSIADSASLDLAGDLFTIETWVKTASTSKFILGKTSGDPNYDYAIYINSTRNLTFYYVGGPVAFADNAIGNDVWTYVAVKQDATDMRCIINLLSETEAKVNLTDTGDTFYIGSAAAGFFLTGLVDEVRISNIGRASAWLAACYYSQSDALLTWGSEEINVITKTLVGVVDAAGILDRETNKSASGVADVTSTFAKAVGKGIAGVSDLTGTIARALTKGIAGTADVTGAAGRATVRTVNGIVDATSSVADKVISKTIMGIVDATGTLKLVTDAIMAGGIAATGAVIRGVKKALAATVAVTSDVSGRKRFKALVGVSALTGTVARAVGKGIVGAADVTGAVSRGIGKALAGAVAVTGSVARIWTEALIGGVVATATAVRKVYKSLVGTVDAAGIMDRKTGKGVVGTADVSGTLARVLAKTIAGVVDVSGVVVRGVGKVVAGIADAVGTIIAQVQFPIDVGSGAINRASSLAPGNTAIAKDHPADGTGALTTVELWCFQAMSNVRVGTFYGSGTSRTCRDYAVLGTVASGSKQTFSGLSIDIEIGDLIGVYFSAGAIELSTPGAGLYYKAGDQTETGTQTYSYVINYEISVYGYGWSKANYKILAGIADAIGVVGRKISKAIFGTVDATGSVVRKPGKIIVGASDVTGTIPDRAITKGMLGTVPISGIIGKAIARAFAAVANATADISGRKRFKALAGLVDVTGTTIRATAKGIPGVVDATGTVIRAMARSFVSVVDASGTIIRAVARSFAGVVDVTGTVVRIWAEELLGGVIATATAVRAICKSIAGTVGVTGTADRAIGKAISGTVGTSGALVKALARNIAGIVDASGAVVRSIGKGIAGVVDVTGIVDRIFVWGEVVVGGVAATAEIGRTIYKSIVGTVATTGTVTKGVARSFAGIVNVTGTVARDYVEDILGGIVATAIAARKVLKNISATVAASGVMDRKMDKGITGTVDVTSTVGRAISKALSVAVDVIGTVTRILHTIYLGGIEATGAVGKAIKKSLSATVNAIGTVTRQAYDMAWEMNKTIRQIIAKVQITYSDPFFAAGVVASASETGRFTYPGQVTDNVTEEAYKWFSLHENLLDGTYHLLPSNQEYSVGWWSATLCDGIGDFLVPPVLTITHQPRTINSLLVVGDDKLDEYPVAFTVKLYTAGDTLVHTETVPANAAVTWSTDIDPHDGVVKQVLTITKWNEPSAVAKIAQFYTMLEETYYSEDGDFFDLNVLEEREHTEPTIPQGNVSSSAITIRLNNIDDVFSAGNYSSHLYGMLLNNRAIKAWLGCILHSGERIWYPLGTFYSRDWRTPEGEAWAEVSGYDMLDRLKQTEFSTSEVYADVTLYDLAIIVMADAGLTSADWDIDPVLDTAPHTIPYAWFNPMSHREALRKIAAAAMGQVYCNRDGKVVVEVYEAPASQPDDFEFYEGNFFTIDHPLEWSQMINSVQARANPRVASAEMDICLDTEAFTVPGSSSVTKVHFFDSSPCIDVVDPVVFTQSDSHITLGARTDYAWGISQTYTNSDPGDEQVLTVTIRGKLLEVQGGRIVEAEDATSIASNGRQTLSEPIASEFWQTSEKAQAVADTLLASYKDPRRDVIMKARGNIALVLGDRIVAPDYRDEVTGEFGIMRQDINFDGGLEVLITAQRIIGGAATYKKALSGTVDVTGTIDPLPWNETRGSVDAIATVGRKITKALAATVTATGTIVCGRKKALTALVDAVASVSRRLFYAKSLSATVTVGGSVDAVIKIEAAAGSLFAGCDASYSTARDLAVANGTVQAGWKMGGHYWTGGGNNHCIWRSGLWFPTGDVVSAEDTISEAWLYLYISTVNIAVDEDIVIQNGQPTYPHIPMVQADFDRTFYAGDGGSENTAGYSPGEWFVIELNATGIGWIQKGATNVTKLFLRGSKDIAGTPHAANEGNNFGGLVLGDHPAYLKIVK